MNKFISLVRNHFCSISLDFTTAELEKTEYILLQVHTLHEHKMKIFVTFLVTICLVVERPLGNQQKTQLYIHIRYIVFKLSRKYLELRSFDFNYCLVWFKLQLTLLEELTL